MAIRMIYYKYKESHEIFVVQPKTIDNQIFIPTYKASSSILWNGEWKG